MAQVLADGLGEGMFAAGEEIGQVGFPGRVPPGFVGDGSAPSG